MASEKPVRPPLDVIVAGSCACDTDKQASCEDHRLDAYLLPVVSRYALALERRIAALEEAAYGKAVRDGE